MLRRYHNLIAERLSPARTAQLEFGGGDGPVALLKRALPRMLYELLEFSSDEEIDPDALFRAHFEGGSPDAEVPDLQGIGILTDGDQTHSVSAADYAGFVVYKQQARTASR